MDFTLQRRGKLLYVNVLYHWALQGMAALPPGGHEAKPVRADLLRRKIDLLLWPEPASDHAELLEGIGRYPGARVEFRHPVGPASRRAAMREDRCHYISHVDGGRYVDECDVLATSWPCSTGGSAGSCPPDHGAPAGQPCGHALPDAHLHRTFEEGDRWGTYRSRPRGVPGPALAQSPGALPQRRGAGLHRRPPRGRAAAGGDGGRGPGGHVPGWPPPNRLSREPGGSWGFHEWIDSHTGEPQRRRRAELERGDLPPGRRGAARQADHTLT